jgi:hypothetical protein
MTREVAQERTGWRDQRISERHRMWGFDCPALDIDFLMLEYDSGVPSALVEFKHEDAPPLRMGHPSIRALNNLCTRAFLPFFLVRYADDFSWFHVTPGNDKAREWITEPVRLTEPEWIKLLYRCRGRNVPVALATRLV